MSMPKIVGPALPNIPWEDKPADCKDVVWRYSQNPVIPRDLIPCSNSIFNSAVVPFEDGFAGVFRCDDRRRFMQLHVGRSKDAINWEIDNDRIEFNADEPEIADFDFGYDPRVCWIEDRYYVTWCNGYHGPTIGVGYWETISVPLISSNFTGADFDYVLSNVTDLWIRGELITGFEAEGLDNVHVKPVPIPTPSAVLLGAFGLGCWRLRKRKIT